MSNSELSPEQFVALTRLLRDAAGLSFDQSRRDSLAYSVSERIRVNGCGGVADYLSLLAGPDGDNERQALLDEVTIPETHFFRNPPQIRALRKFVLPALLKQAADAKTLRIWSAGCSTGEEPYTLAMLVRELLPATAGWDVRIIATDVSTRALTAAEAGRYSERAFVMTDPIDRQRFFALDTQAGNWAIRDELRDLVEFRHHNLVVDAPPFAPGQVDLVLCRNVTIYFDRDTTERLMRRLHTTLRDGGYLFLGHAETLWHITDAFALTSLGDAFVYRRDDGDGPALRAMPDRRTEDEPRPTKADRRRGPLDRRDLSRQRPPAAPLEPVHREPAHDPMDAVRSAMTAARYAEAADLAAEVIAAAPLRQEAYYLQGLALANQSQHAEAVVVLRKAVYLDPDDGFAHFLLGGSLERLGERLAAGRSYRAAAHALARRPSHAVAPELGGRTVAELAAVCAALARTAETTDGPAPQ